MICKEDVVNWFRDLKSYNRIDTMCVLLNMCLPFELRFLGTYLEELGRRDAPELRGAELKVNNPQEFIADIASGEPTDRRIRRKMALFLALFRTCNHTYANELFKTLEGWGARGDLQRLFEEDVLQELLLVYTMATNHPVFSFEQRLHCGEIFTKLKSCEPKPAQRSYQQQDSREDSLEHQHQPSHHQHQQPVTQHQHHQQQQQSRHQSMDSLHSNSPQQSPIQQQQQQQHQPVHLPNSTPPPAPGTATLHPALTPNAPMSMQLAPQSGATTTIALSYLGQPGLTQMITNDGSLTTHYMEPLPQPTQLPLQHDFTIPPPGSLATGVPARWAQSVYQQLSHPPPASSPHLSNPSSPIHSRTASPTRIHPNSVQHRISRNQQNDQQQQQQQQSQVQMQSLKTVDEDQTMLMMSQMQVRNGMRPTHSTLPRPSKQSYVSQLPPYHHQQQQQQQQHHSQRGDGTSGGSGNYPSLRDRDIINHQSKSTGSDSGSSIGSDVSPPETPGMVSVSAGGGGGGGGVLHARSSNRSNMRNVNGRLEKLNYSQHQQQQQFAGGDQMVTSVGQNFLITGTVNGAAMSSNGNNGASGSSVVSGPLLISPAAAAPPPPPGSTGTGLLFSTQPFATGPYAGGATGYQTVSTASHLVQQHRQLTTATLPHGNSFRPAPYPPAMQQSTHEGIVYHYHPPAGATVPPSSLPFLPTPPPPGPGPASSTASTQTSLPNLRSSPSQPSVAVATSQQAVVSSLGLLPAKGTGTEYGVTTPTLPLVGTAFGTGAASCYNCGSQKHGGLDCPEASMEDMTRNSNFTLDYNTTSSGPSSVTGSGGTLGVASNNNNNNNLNPSTIISLPPPIDHAPASLDRDNSTSSSSSSSASSSSGVSKSNNNANSANNNGNNSSNSSNNSNNSSLDVPSSLTSASSSSMAAVGEPTGVSGAPASVAAAAVGSNSSSTGSNTTNSNSNNLVNASGK
ncbi:rho GTPase-activating protein gacF [Anopheles cruzii]|uniref:rho GTPase-activating protein gacF n=1 Tax=Anopheles cruzii TaxID=68878 RepID=UPI0022EC8F0B|nr:rho GTPase-activating protein gacF [Anopheles cruzii]